MCGVVYCPAITSKGDPMAAAPPGRQSVKIQRGHTTPSQEIF